MGIIYRCWWWKLIVQIINHLKNIQIFLLYLGTIFLIAMWPKYAPILHVLNHLNSGGVSPSHSQDESVLVLQYVERVFKQHYYGKKRVWSSINHLPRQSSLSKSQPPVRNLFRIMKLGVTTRSIVWNIGPWHDIFMTCLQNINIDLVLTFKWFYIYHKNGQGAETLNFGCVHHIHNH